MPDEACVVNTCKASATEPADDKIKLDSKTVCDIKSLLTQHKCASEALPADIVTNV